jgi:hypothetical protein
VVEVKRPFLLVTIAIMLAGVALFGSSDTGLSIADTGIPDNEVTGKLAKE